jgi:hypothetical protein
MSNIEAALPGAVRISDDLYIHPGRGIRLQRAPAGWSASLTSETDGETLYGGGETEAAAIADLAMVVFEQHEKNRRAVKWTGEAGSRAFPELGIGANPSAVKPGITAKERAGAQKDVSYILPNAELKATNDIQRVWRDKSIGCTATLTSAGFTLQLVATGRTSLEAARKIKAAAIQIND